MAPRSHRCLLVEDDEQIARMYAIKLELSGWTVEHAPDAETAVKLATSRPPDAVVLDLMLPGGPDGVEVLEKLRADRRTRDALVIILSNSQGTAGGVARARKLGALDWLTKSSTSPADLAARLEQLVGNA